MNTYVVLKNFKDSKNDFSLHKEGEDVELSKERSEEIAASPGGPFIKLKTAGKVKEEKADDDSVTKEEEKADDDSVTKEEEKADDDSVTKEDKTAGKTKGK